MAYQHPIKITIPVPIDAPRKRGPQGTSAGANFRLRMSVEEYERVHEEAHLLGISGAMFARSAIIRVALALKKHREGDSSDIEAEYDEGTRIR